MKSFRKTNLRYIRQGFYVRMIIPSLPIISGCMNVIWNITNQR